MFNELKATGLAATFLSWAANRKVSRFDLLKLLYATERICLREEGRLITKDVFVNMERGPVMSKTYDCIKGGGAFWGQHIRQDGSYHLKLVTSPSSTLLTDDELAYAREAWDTYNHILDMHIEEKTAYMHNEFPEWIEPTGGKLQTPLSVRDMLHIGLGLDKETAESSEAAMTSFSDLQNFSEQYG